MYGLSLFFCNGCHDLTTLRSSPRDVTVITVKDVNYRAVISGISKRKGIHLLENSGFECPGYI